MVTSQSKALGFSSLEVVFSMTAFLLMWIGSLRCNFVQFNVISGYSEPLSLQFGMWRLRTWTFAATVDAAYLIEGCGSYPDGIDIDPSWKAARAFSIMAFIFGLFVLIGSCVAGCAIISDRGIKTYGVLAPGYLLTAIFQGLTLLLLNSNVCRDNGLVKEAMDLTRVTFTDVCSIGQGAKLIISATVFWFAAAFTSFAARHFEKAESGVVEEEEEQGDNLEKPEELKAEQAESGQAGEEVPQ
jgi:hypothetical protein